MVRIHGHIVTWVRNADRVWVFLTTAALASLTYAGCVSEPTCSDLGCDPGRICDDSTGECIDPTCEPGECPDGQICDPESGACQEAAGDCSDPDQSCGPDELCNAQEGVCEPASDCAEEGCSSAVETCDSQTGECVPKPCEIHADCPTQGYVCGEDGTCIAGCLLEQGNCPPGQNCRDVSETGSDSEADIGRCLQSCQSNQECPHGRYCPESTCEPEPLCESDGDCPRDDEVCRNGRCAAPPCRSEKDCPSNQICDRATGVCLGGDCADDNFAPNQTWEEAADISFEKYTDLQLCRGRSDWFALQADSAEAIRLRLKHDVQTDPDLVVYDSLGRIIATDEQAPPPNADRGRFVSRTTFASNSQQTLRIRVFSHRRDDASGPGSFPLPETTSYELTVDSAVQSFCADDPYEENDTRSTADRLPSDFGSAPQFDFAVCADDRDWYQLSAVPAHSQLQARLVDVPREAEHLRLAVLSEGGDRFELTPAQALTLLRTGPEQDWYMLVYSRTNSSAEYGIRYNLEAPYDCPEAGEHENVEDAIPLRPQIETTFQLCPAAEQWETDWVELDPPPSNSLLRVDAIPETPNLESDLEVALFEKVPEGVQRVRSALQTDDGFALTAAVEPDQSLFVRIRSESRPGVLQFEPKYRLRYEFSPN